MPDEKKPLKSSDNRKKKKKKKKRKKTTPEDTETPQPVSLAPDTLPVPLSLPLLAPGPPRGPLTKLKAASKKEGERLSGRKIRKTPKDSLVLLTASNKTSGVATQTQGYVTEVSSRESLRWEGALDDPRAEETRMELYRANRRQRYIAHRKAQDAIRQAFS